jgi:CHAT domain-containing protein
MADDNRAGRALEALLLQPVAADLKRLGINALLLALDRGLQGIPFAALPYANGSVVDHFAITVTPALALTDLKPQAMAQQPRRTVLAGASTFRNGLMPLHMAEQELQQLASLHTDALVLFAGSFQTKTLLSRTREQPVHILHLATHADFSGKGADGARIYTSDGELSLSQLGRELRQGQPEPIDLFVLNACRTAVGDEDKELGIAGLALQAGASSALGNLWYVDDVVTAAFSVQFHRALQQGLSKDQALQKTQQLFRTGQIKVRSHTIINENGVVLLTGLSHSEQIRLANLEAPYFWAGAVLTGRPW